MNKEKWVRSTFVLDHKMVDDIRYCSSRMGVSRSELLRGLGAEPLSDMAKLLRGLPANPTEADIRQMSLSGLDLIELRAGPEIATLLHLGGKS